MSFLHPGTSGGGLPGTAAMEPSVSSSRESSIRRKVTRSRSRKDAEHVVPLVAIGGYNRRNAAPAREQTSIWQSSHQAEKGRSPSVLEPFRVGVLALRVPAPTLVNLSELINVELDAPVARTA
ncbi:hypothetical protein VTK56DRAFT_5937 [Thermocarpiscus australiensis]